MVDLRTALGHLDVDHAPGWEPFPDAPAPDPADGVGHRPPPPEEPSVGEEIPDEPERIIVNNRQLRTVTVAMRRALEKTNDPPSVYVRGGALTRVRLDERARPIVEPMSTDVLRYRVARVADTVKVLNDGQLRDVPPPLDAIRDLAAAGDWPGFPPLEAVVEIPTLRADGTVHWKPGYDRRTKLLHVPAKGLEVPSIPDAPTAQDRADAVALIEEALCDFPFDTPSDKANAIAAMLTPVVRPAIDGPVPLALVDAPEPGTGKGLLVNLISVIATGRPAAMRPLASHDDEVRKMITSTLAEGPTMVVLDNIEDAIRSPSLALVLTSDEWADRILGRSETVKLPNRATWMATGNNLQVGGDLGRRCYRIRLDARQAKPYTRTGFRHEDLLSWAAEHRGELIAALLTIARSWYADNRPTVAVPPLGGFTPWARLAGSVLHHAGVTGFLDNLAQFHAEADTDSDDWEAFLTAWRDTFGPKVITVGELVERLDPQIGHPLLRALPAELASGVGRNGFAKQLGIKLRSRAGRHFGNDGVHIVDRGKDRNKVSRWAVEFAAETMLATVSQLPLNGTEDAVELPATTRDGGQLPATTRDYPRQSTEEHQVAGSAGSRGDLFKQHVTKTGDHPENAVEPGQGLPATTRTTRAAEEPDQPPFPTHEPEIDDPGDDW
jgi:hypothetical protein